MSKLPIHPIKLSVVEELVGAVEATFGKILDAAREKTKKGKKMDEAQVHCERLACLAAEIAAMKCLLAHANARAQISRGKDLLAQMAGVFSAEVSHRLICNMELFRDGFGVSEALVNNPLYTTRINEIMREGLIEARIRNVGATILQDRGIDYLSADSEGQMNLRREVREFAENEVHPIAERIHRRNELVPEAIIRRMGEMGLFGLNVPRAYGGSGAGKQEMVIATEELSRQSMATVGSMLTRSEVAAESLLKGGTDAQKKKWLPKIASGKLMVGLSVTEPGVGSDVALSEFRAETSNLVSNPGGYLLSGEKSWCTFAGRANILSLLARTDPDLQKGAGGLSLFFVEKNPFRSRQFEISQPNGGTLTGVAEPTPGYRGLLSFNLKFSNYFVPIESLIGESAGLGRGFYLLMQGFSVGRLQTAGRATGLALAALECAAEYAQNRWQFGQPIANFQLTQYKLGRMATHAMAAQQLTYATATEMDNEDLSAVMPAMAKLFASDVAVRVAKEGQLIHGGWGYSEKFPISRHVVDALVLGLFEGINPVLALKVIARKMLST